MMNFRTLKYCLVNNILGPAERGRFQTIGFQRQVTNADEVLNENRFVQVFFSSGDFSKQSSRMTGSQQHDVTFNIFLIASKAAEGDLSIINNPDATPAQIAAALERFDEAADLVDESIDELFEIVYQILMDARNIDLGLDKGQVANRFIDSFNKDTPVAQGEYVVLSGTLTLTARVVEEVEGDIGYINSSYYDTTIDIDGDDIEKTGIIVNNET